MDRREFLTRAGAVGVAGAGVYGVYHLVIRDPTSLSGPRVDEDHEPATYDIPTREGDLLLGITPPSRDVTVLDPREAWLDRRHAVVGKFLDMGHPTAEIERLVNSLLHSTWERGHTPHLFWQPFFPDRDNTSNEVNREIANGEWDDYLDDWANALAYWLMHPDEPDRRVYLNLAPEFNGDWSPWSPALGDEDEEDFVAMWRHVHDRVMDTGLTDSHVQWIWTLDNTTRGVDREACYPGDEYVDWAGIHGYNWANWGSWSTPEEVYGPTIDTIGRITDAPIAITEFGTSSLTDDGEHDPEKKDEWIRDAYAFLGDENVRMALYFDFVKETDWAVFDTPHPSDIVEINDREYGVAAAYKEVATNDRILPANEEHPRTLTDDEFQGTF